MDSWCEAIATSRLLSFEYDGHLRVVVAAAHGWHTSTGVESIRCYQVGGSSSTGRLPAWRLFTIGKMIDRVLLAECFEEVPSGYKPNDKHLGNIHCQLRTNALPGGASL
jgi:hypothetical protein